MCEFCLASSSIRACLPFDFRPWANWRQYLITQRHYLLTEGDSPFCDMPGWSIFRNKMDMLHLCFLGFARDISACMLLILAGTFRPHLDLADGLAWLHTEFRVWCKQRRTSCNIGRFSLKLIGLATAVEKVYPILASRIKGAKVKILMKWLANMSTRARALDVTPAAKNRQLMMLGIVGFVHECDRAALFLTPDQKERAGKCARTFLLAYQLESERSYDRPLFKMKPKVHYFGHMVDFMMETGENPASLDTWDYENFCGRIKRVCRNTHRTTASLRTAQRYLLLMAIRWRRRDGKQCFVCPSPCWLHQAVLCRRLVS